jgi:hypothetical protein
MKQIDHRPARLMSKSASVGWSCFPPVAVVLGLAKPAAYLSWHEGSHQPRVWGLSAEFSLNLG